jgi:hypothetical protein
MLRNARDFASPERLLSSLRHGRCSKIELFTKILWRPCACHGGFLLTIAVRPHERKWPCSLGQAMSSSAAKFPWRCRTHRQTAFIKQNGGPAMWLDRFEAKYQGIRRAKGACAYSPQLPAILASPRGSLLKKFYQILNVIAILLGSLPSAHIIIQKISSSTRGSNSQEFARCRSGLAI